MSGWGFFREDLNVARSMFEPALLKKNIDEKQRQLEEIQVDLNKLPLEDPLRARWLERMWHLQKGIPELEAELAKVTKTQESDLAGIHSSQELQTKLSNEGSKQGAGIVVSTSSSSQELETNNDWKGVGPDEPKSEDINCGPSALTNRPPLKKKASKGRPLSLSVQTRREIIQRVAATGIRGSRYCEELARRGLSTPIDWQKLAGCPKNYLDAWNHPSLVKRKLFRQRISDEKYKATKAELARNRPTR